MRRKKMLNDRRVIADSSSTTAVREAADDQRGVKRWKVFVSIIYRRRVWFMCSLVIGSFVVAMLNIALTLWIAPTDDMSIAGLAPNSVHQPRPEFEIWPNDVTDKTMQRITEQDLFLQAYARQLNNSVISSFVTDGDDDERKFMIKNRRTVVILTVGKYLFENFADGREEFFKRKCPITDCWLTNNRDQYQDTADALLLMEAGYDDIQSLLPKPAHQIWIVRHHESPRQNLVAPSALSNLVNWTITYRRDSTIQLPYGYMTARNYSDAKGRDAEMSTINYAGRKTKKIAWIVSNCERPFVINGRFSYATELSKYIQVDIYGKCGKIKCGNDCFEMIQNDYKFYLAFENSNCKDYITEKLFRNALSYEALPIVMGARPEDYADVLPPHSYIHVDDFRSPKDLADYLHVLDENDTLYNEYFRWKTDWQVVRPTFPAMWCCRLCGLLHSTLSGRTPYVHWYTDFRSWWEGACNATWVKRNSVETWQSWRTDNA